MRIYPRGQRCILWADIQVDGQRIKRSTGTTDRKSAQEYAARLADSLWRARRLGEQPAVTWDAAVIAWCAEHQHLRSIEDIKRILRWLTARLQGRPLAEITDGVVRQLVAERRAQRVPGGRATSGATVNRHLAHLSAILHYAHRRGWLPAVPPIAKLPEPRKRIAWITPDQAHALLDELPPHLAAMATFALATGLRESNVRLLCWQQVDMARAVAWIYADQAKGGRDIAVPLNADALAALRAQQGMHTRWVFPVPRWERKAAPDAVPVQAWDAPTGKISNHAWRKACIRAGLPTLRFHDLRHTWASWHVQRGTPLQVLQTLGGWASLAMVERYAHLSPGHVAAWAGNSGRGTTEGTTADRVPSENGPEGPSVEGESMGWLMGLEPTTTGITTRSGRSGHGNVLKINSLATPRKRKTG